MSNSDILSKADKVLRPVLKELEAFSWIRIEGCCAGHKQEDSLWLEINVLGSSGLRRLMEVLKILDGKLSGTDCRVDCLLSYASGADIARSAARLDSDSDRDLLAFTRGLAPEPVDDRRNAAVID